MVSPVLPWWRSQLLRTLQQQRAHALLVHGPAGVGQLAFSLALAAAWLCERPAADGLACGRCDSCHQVDRRSHADLRVVVPEAMRAEAGLDTGDEPVADDDGKKRKPSREIRVEQVRAALAFSVLTASRGGAKVLLLHPAETINLVSANALLKTLEEPAGSLRFILSGQTPDALMPTLRSRCQAVPLPLPAREQALEWLTAQQVDEPAVLLDACGGQPLTARDCAAAGWPAAAWTQFPAQVASGQVAALTAWPLPLLIQALQRLCDDQVRVTLGQPPRFFTAPQARVRGGDLHRLTAWAAELRQLARHAEHPWNLGLAAEAILARARNAAQQAPAAARVH